MLSSACKVCFRFLHTHVSGCSVWMFWKKLLILGSIFMKNFWSDWLIWKWFRVKFLLYSRFTSSFCSVWKNDENILLILSAIALFTPERLNVVHQNVIKKVQVISVQKISIRVYFLVLGWIFLLAAEISPDQVWWMSGSGGLSHSDWEIDGVASA